MKSISGKKLAQILEKKYQKDFDSVSVPIHGNRDLPIGTLKAIMKDANLTEDDLL